VLEKRREGWDGFESIVGVGEMSVRRRRKDVSESGGREKS